MKKHEYDILYHLYTEPYINQRILAKASGHSLGVVNKSLNKLISQGFLDGKGRLTKLSRDLIDSRKPKNAIILAAGFGMRMVPINLTTPKALIEVNGERLIDRLISQLHDVGIRDITVIVGFMKDNFEYLIDEYGVKLTYAADYASTNNIHSLRTAIDEIGNTYIIPCDIWCDRNPFRSHELYSWYMVSDIVDETSSVRINRKMELIKIPKHSGGNAMIGICYLTEDEATVVKEKILSYCKNPLYDDKFWEESLYKNDKMIVRARVVHSSDVVEINTYEQLRDLDSDSNQLKSDALKTISKELCCNGDNIVDIKVLKKGMTNRSFLFRIDDGENVGKYIMRIPGEGTDKLINREHEAMVFKTISGLGICDDPVYINSENGYKITKYLEGIRACDPENEDDLHKCMKKLRAFHDMKLKVDHSFDIFDQIEFYESLWGGEPSVYHDYMKTKENVMGLKTAIDSYKKEFCLTHIDAVPDNFLFYKNENGEEMLQLTDWEYSGMQDPHVDIAMFCIYAMYDKERVDRLIDIYFGNGCDIDTRAKIYCYISMCGLLWSNWCEYKRNLGVEFGEYSLAQYRYAKEYFKYAKELMN
ncbi:winged helix-turn-helix transcriptional regulator [Butyrivibrio sp. X503]|nr:winged helix-turn-helix transcriptional regulator [Butyrivibrio sp. X503]